MKKRLFFVVFFSLLAVLILGGAVLAQDGDSMMPAFDDLDEGWNIMVPAGDTICSNGTEFNFYVRPADPEKLLVYFQGGGACWFGETCDLGATPTYDPFVDETDVPTESGIFEFMNTENPFADYTMVMVPYCTGDVHIGNQVTTYEVAATDEVDAHEVTINHMGYTNSMSAINWAFENVEAPQDIFVTGSSAGSIPSPFYTMFVAEQYPDAHITQLGDASGGYRNPDAIPLIMGAWGTLSILPDWEEFADVTEENLSFETLYIAAAQRYPDVTFSQFNAAHDETQYFFLSLTGIVDTPLPDLLEASFAEIEAGASDNFVTYTSGGEMHTILGRPEFYTYDSDGVRFVDWITALANGDDVENVMCVDCENAPDAEED